MKYKNFVLSQNIRPFKVFEAAKWLTENGTLFQQESIKLNPDWNALFAGGKENSIQMHNKSACSSSRYLTETGGAVVSHLQNTTIQSLSENYGLLSFHFDKCFICFNCEQVLTDCMNLQSHMLCNHQVESDSEGHEESNCLPVFFIRITVQVMKWYCLVPCVVPGKKMKYFLPCIWLLHIIFHH